MIRALLLLTDPSRTWQKIKTDQHSVLRISCVFFLPLLLLTAGGEALGLTQLGVEGGTMTEKLFKVSPVQALRYEVAQCGLSLVVAYLGAAALTLIGASFHRRHTYKECFTSLAYSLSPLLLLRLLDAFPAVNTWVCYGIGIFLTLSLFYQGIPMIMRPDPSNALGLFLLCSFLLLGATALAHFLAVSILEKKLLG